MKEKIITEDCGEIEFDGIIVIPGSVKVSKLTCAQLKIESGGNLNCGGYLSCGGDLRFSFHIIFKSMLKAKIIRLASSDNFERNFWIEKLNLFGFTDVAEKIKIGCFDDIRKKINPHAEELLACKYWTVIERLAIQSLIDGKVQFECGTNC